MENKIEQYILQHTDPEPALLQELNRETHLKILQPRMLSGHIQGRLLSMISKMIQPERVIEIGTFTGYSALCLAEGLLPNGHIDTIEINDELHDFAKSFIERSPYINQIKQHIGDATKLIPQLKQTYDLAFIDGDKHEYDTYYELILPEIKPGKFILIDNVLWSGKVVEQIDENDTSTQAIVEFNKKIQNDSRVQKIMLPIRDGIYLLQKT